ncbi:hypothetical protein M409DRAFT_59795 [Zasmidium cellare ATCC 36951]|uniref:Uncharacterized protein n=1 Tax=Zasmidium cellare ATCC 36951 TaxID=1080233 RepID=A0A6A6C1M8_ZASCE|nr:uncharacterized protein M409DRAFT_59795 [Zasmidium cellare ATCC 36951]KAF2160773.1 hypothetical protein M409DRAFT_59795 [Zasmidium cellare ATCC 36951]
MFRGGGFVVPREATAERSAAQRGKVQRRAGRKTRQVRAGRKQRTTVIGTVGDGAFGTAARSRVSDAGWAEGGRCSRGHVQDEEQQQQKEEEVVNNELAGQRPLLGGSSPAASSSGGGGRQTGSGEGQHAARPESFTQQNGGGDGWWMVIMGSVLGKGSKQATAEDANGWTPSIGTATAREQGWPARAARRAGSVRESFSLTPPPARRETIARRRRQCGWCHKGSGDDKYMS